MANAYEQRAASRREALLAMLTGAVAEPAAGLAGLYGLATGGAAKGARNVEATRNAMTYQPRDQQAMNAFAKALAPVTDRIEASKRYLGDNTLTKTGKPGLATAAYMLPDVALTLLGARSAGVKGPTMKQMAERSAMPTGPARQLGIFSGKGAKTADLNAMALAQRRLAEGADPRQVWQQQGWMRGPDGHMRFEIDDSRSSADLEAAMDDWRFAGRDVENEPVPLDNVYTHNELYAGYPDAANVDFRAWSPERMRGARGAYSDKHNAVTIRDSLNDGEARDILGHELQHYVQTREGFAPGGNPKGAREALQQQMSQGGTDLSLFDDNDLYRRLAGEAEARAVQKRMDYTPEQRREVFPLDDYDVPIDELIMRGQSGGSQMSVAPAKKRSKIRGKK